MGRVKKEEERREEEGNGLCLPICNQKWKTGNYKEEQH